MHQNIVLRKIWETAEKYPNKMCIFEKEKEITYAEHKNAIVNGYWLLKELGVKKGDRVAVVAEQTIRFLGAVSAVHLLGAIVIPIEKNLHVNKISEIVLNLEISWIISDAELNIADVRRIESEKFESYNKGDKDVGIKAFPDESDLADILFTTGTTGKPKGIEVTHRTNRAIAENVIDSVELKEDDIELIPTPINHSLGLRRYYGAMYRGSTIGLTDGVIYMEDFFYMLEKAKVTAITLVPAMLAILLKYSKDRLQAFKEQIRFIQLGSAPIGKKERELLCELLPNSRLYNTYGATESGCTCILDFNKLRDKAFCIGRLTVNAKLSFVDDTGAEILATKENMGYMVFDGPMNMHGYWKDPELTSKVLKEGKIYTNDFGYIGEDGYIYLLGRRDDVINSGGNKIAPSEVEDMAMRLSEIEECACVPKTDRMAGQVPKLYVVMKQGEIFDREKILTFLAKNLEFYKVPKYVELLDKLPRAYNGKILRKELIERNE